MGVLKRGIEPYAESIRQPERVVCARVNISMLRMKQYRHYNATCNIII